MQADVIRKENWLMLGSDHDAMIWAHHHQEQPQFIIHYFYFFLKHEVEEGDRVI